MFKSKGEMEGGEVGGVNNDEILSPHNSRF